ncbi:MAG: NAD(P)-dependent oxidoreductase [Pseudomonadota bacterium]
MLKNKTIFITGGSRGIGLAIAKRAAKDGANIVIAAKTDKPHPTLPGTIHSAVKEIEEAGGQGLAVQMDVREDSQVEEAIEKAASHFGGIDIVINNASAIFLANTSDIPMKRYDLMHDVNVRGSFITAQKALPYLKKSKNAHILTLSPPIDLDMRWFENHTAYTMSKYSMSLCAMGLAAELKKDGIASNALWPKTLIYTSALKMVGNIKSEQCRKDTIMADAAYEILVKDSSEATGQFYIDEDLLKEAGVEDFSQYLFDPNSTPIPDLYIS